MSFLSGFGETNDLLPLFLELQKVGLIGAVRKTDEKSLELHAVLRSMEKLLSVEGYLCVRKHLPLHVAHLEFVLSDGSVAVDVQGNEERARLLRFRVVTHLAMMFGDRFRSSGTDLTFRCGLGAMFES